MEIRNNMCNDLYHQHYAVSSTQLKNLYENGPTFLKHVSDIYDEGRDKEALEFGSMLHELVLEPELFQSKYWVEPRGVDRRTKAYKDELSEVMEIAESEERIITPITWKTRNHLECLRQSLLHTKINIAGTYFSIERLVNSKDSAIEQARFWEDKETGIPMRAKADIFYKNMLVIDIKTISVMQDRWTSYLDHIRQYHYDIQAAHYAAGFQAKGFILIFVEKADPFEVRSIEIECLEGSKGHYKWREAVQTYYECQTCNDWERGIDLEIYTGDE